MMDVSLQKLKSLIKEEMMSTVWGTYQHEPLDNFNTDFAFELVQKSSRLIEELEADVLEQQVSEEAAVCLVQAKQALIKLGDILSSDNPQLETEPELEATI
jgi:predicted metal-dependent hydrolase